ncbi:aromatic-ring-hydroxylating dioxygenase subunit beta [Actinomadura graeca]|uniref:Aromatic-ring-hydroxylating dioxygenase subunit beta n=1 Tax=Actinomadura graeca TaxID=2750812 RepID=A0ABX8QVE3_9ACTN|nr:aromatic-ring-hydroxylating dioxygenase subunit beta [Actinomadura graeca]QXJ22608.1 aromatic-ring-hydroxylating dioxygenase subunit beta [Actinomadura graeca]
MTLDQIAGVRDTTEAMLLQYRVEQFLYREAQLLDGWLWDEWAELFAEDVRYWMPLRKNRLRRQRTADEAPQGIEIALIDDDHTALRTRVDQMKSGQHWAEDPPSRCRHLVTNVRVTPAGGERAGDGADGARSAGLRVRSNFIVYRNRLETEVDIWAGERQDVLRPAGDSFRIAARTILLDQNVVLSKNLSVFF